MIEQASLVIGEGNWAVKSDSLLGYKINGGKYYPREMSVVRATTGTRINEDGLVEVVPYNLLRYSEDFSNAAWIANDVVVTGNTTSSPNGTSTADSIANNSVNVQHRFYQGPISNLSSPQSVTFSVYLKYNNHRYFSFGLTDDNFYRSQVVVDLLNGVITENYVYNVSDSLTSTITNVGNGWYRVTGTFNYTTALSGSGSAYLLGLLLNQSTFTSGGYVGTGTSVFIWGSQLVEGTSALDYLPTTDRLDVARIDYSSGSAALLVEPQRTNLNTYSEDISQSQYGKNRCSVSVNSVVSPDGTTNADKIVQDSSNTSWGGLTQVYSPTGSATLSVFAKKIDNDYIAIIGHNVNPTSAWFNIANGTVGTTEANVTSANIVDYGNGWYRCSITATTITRFNVFHASNDGGSSAATNSETALWGFQLEVGSYPTSYIPTTSASVTRNADVISKTGIADLIGVNQGSIFVELDANGINTGLGSYIFDLSDGTNFNQNRIAMYWTSENSLNIFYGYGGTFAAVPYTFNFLTTKKVAVRWTSTQIQAVINGVAQTAITYGNSSPSKLNLASRFNNDEFLSSAIKVCVLFNTTQTTADLISLTTI